MKRKAIKDRKKTTSISLSPSERSEWNKAMKKLGKEKFNEFVVTTVNEHVEDVLHGSPKRDIPDMVDQLEELTKAVRSLTTKVGKLEKAIAEKNEEDSNLVKQ